MDNQDSITRILAVDDEQQVLSALRRVFRGAGFEITVANSGKEGLEVLESQEFDILLSDMRMPEMDGATFLAKSMDVQPNARRILLTGYSDQESTIRAINEGQVHQYLSKPWDNQALRDVIASEAVIKQQQEETSPEEIGQLKAQVAEVGQELAQASTYANLAREELIKQASTTIKVISGLVNQLAPTPQGFTQKVTSHSMAMGKLLKLDKAVINELRTASLLFQLGKLALDDNLRVAKPYELQEEAKEDFNRYGMLGADILTPINGLDFAANLVRYHNENFNGSGPQKLKGKGIPLGARILRLAVDFHQLLAGYLLKDPLSSHDACKYLQKHAGNKYDPALTKLYIALIKKLAEIHPEAQDKLVLPDELVEGMTISRDVTSNEGIFLLAKGCELNASLISKLHAYLACNPQELNVFIKQPLEETPVENDEEQKQKEA